MRTDFANLGEFAHIDHVLFNGYAFDDAHPEVKPFIVAAAENVMGARIALNTADAADAIRGHLAVADEHTRKAAHIIQTHMGTRVSLSESLGMARWLVEISVTMMRGCPRD